MTKASDNAFPSILITEATEPSAPAAGKQRLYIDSTSHKLKRTDSSGTDVTIEGLADPMTTRGDVIVRNASNVTARLAVGSSGKVLSSDGTDVSWQTPSGGGGSTPTLLLDFVLASNIGPITLTAATWIEIIANQTFTKAAAGSLIEISIRGLGINNAGAGSYVATRLQIDSAGTPINVQLGGIFRISTNENIFEGCSPIYISGLSAAAHTVKVMAYASGGDSFFCRPVSTPPEFFGMQVIEHL